MKSRCQRCGVPILHTEKELFRAQTDNSAHKADIHSDEHCELCGRVICKECFDWSGWQESGPCTCTDCKGE